MNKKLLQAERGIASKLKLAQGKQSTLQSSIRSEQPAKGAKDDDQVKKLKARVTNVEKSYEFSKTKIKQLEEELQKKVVELQKREDDITKLKNQKNKLLKEIKKQEQPMSMDDLIPTKENEEADQFNQSMMSEALEASTFKKAAMESKRKSMRSPSGSKHKEVHEVVQPKVSASVGPSASSSEIQSQIKMSA